MQKSALQYGEIIFQSKVIPIFCQNVPSSIHSITVYLRSDCRFFTLYGSDCREEKKKAKHGKMRWTPKQ